MSPLEAMAFAAATLRAMNVSNDDRLRHAIGTVLNEIEWHLDRNSAPYQPECTWQIPPDSDFPQSAAQCFADLIADYR